MPSGSCPLPKTSHDVVKLGHGSGGRMTSQLIESCFLPYLGNTTLGALEDAADVNVSGVRLAVSTDSYVIRPLFFDGGNIGSLCVNGTINDLCMRLARPLYLTAAFILEEGFRLEDLKLIVQSMREACENADIQMVAGDTKVVNKGAGDGVFITTTGIGLITVSDPPSASRARVGDVIIVSGDIGRHGMSILCRREGIELETELASDCAALREPVERIAALNVDIHSLRDLTRGGLSSALNEVAQSSSVGMEVLEEDVPLNDSVKASCELLGLDAFHVACEGRFMAIVPQRSADSVLNALRSSELGKNAAVIGRVLDDHRGTVVLRSKVGGRRILEQLSGDQLPRIC